MYHEVQINRSKDGLWKVLYGLSDLNQKSFLKLVLEKYFSFNLIWPCYEKSVNMVKSKSFIKNLLTVSFLSFILQSLIPMDEMKMWKMYKCPLCLTQHPWSGQHLCLKIDADEKTILKYILEYVPNCSSQMKSKSMGLFLKQSMI